MTNALRRRIRALVLALTFGLPLFGAIATAQSVPLVSVAFSMTGVGQGPIIPLLGQSTCSIQLDNAGSGLTLVPQATSAKNPTAGAQWSTATGINSGSISTFGNFVGNVAGTGLTGFSFSITALSSGTVSGTETCSGAVGLGSGGGATPAPFPTQPFQVTGVGGSPIPVTCSGCGGGSVTFPYAAATAQAAVANSGILCEYWNGTTIDSCKDVNGGQGIVSIYGAAGNALVVNASGQASVNVAAVATTIPVSLATSVAVTQGTSPWVVNTPVPGPTAASGIPEQVICDPTTSTQCAKVSSTGYLNTQLVNSGGSGLSTGAPGDTVTNSPTGLFGINYNLFFNGTTWTSARNTTAAGNNYAGTGLPAATSYCQYNTTLPTPSAGNYAAEQCNANGVPYTVPTPSATTPAVEATPASSATSVTLLAAGAATNGWSICNSSTAILYISKTATATAGVYFVALPAAATVPQCYIETNPGMYDGIVTGIWAAANGNAVVTYW
jgi:hypothetical protein